MTPRFIPEHHPLVSGCRSAPASIRSPHTNSAGLQVLNPIGKWKRKMWAGPRMLLSPWTSGESCLGGSLGFPCSQVWLSSVTVQGHAEVSCTLGEGSLRPRFTMPVEAFAAVPVPPCGVLSACDRRPCFHGNARFWLPEWLCCPAVWRDGGLS